MDSRATRQKWEIETCGKEDIGELYDTQSEPPSLEDENMTETHQNLSQELVPPVGDYMPICLNI